MGYGAGFWAMRVTGLKHGPLWVLTRAALSCDDETGLLKWSISQLAAACRMTTRSLEKHLPLLAKLDLLRRADVGFRVVGWVLTGMSEKVSENFSVIPRMSTENFSENFSEKKERTKERKELYRNTGESRAREDREYKTAWCRICLEPHEWVVGESYIAPQMKYWACPAAVAQLEAERVVFGDLVIERKER